MQAGADDYVTKPFEIEVLLHKIAALCAREVAAGNGTPGRETLSASAAMRAVEFELLRVTDTVSPVLLLGETGVGKEVAARQLHNASLRRGAALHRRQLPDDPHRSRGKRNVRPRARQCNRLAHRACRPG